MVAFGFSVAVAIDAAANATVDATATATAATAAAAAATTAAPAANVSSTMLPLLVALPLGIACRGRHLNTRVSYEYEEFYS